MARMSRWWPSPAIVVALIALVAALSGTGYAAGQLGRGASDSAVKRKHKPQTHLLRGPKGAKGDTGAAGQPGATGSAGGVGLQGAKGDTGSVGPTFSAHIGTTPGALINSNSDVRQLSVSLPTAGNLMIAGHAYGRISCGTGNGCVHPALGLFLDNQPVPGSELALPDLSASTFFPSSTDEEFVVSGRAANVSAGAHMISLRVGDVNGSSSIGFLEFTSGDAGIDATLTG
jgi:hypothetical protein